MKKILTLILVCMVIGLPGCGGPKYASTFKEWLGLQIATEHFVKLTGVKTTELSAGQTTAIFTFSANYVTVEPLYKTISSIDVDKLRKTVEKVMLSGIPEEVVGADKLKLLMDDMGNPDGIRIELAIATPAGTNGTLSGKVEARLSNDGSWAYRFLDPPSLNLVGQTPPKGKYVIENTPEWKKYVSEKTANINAIEQRGDELLKTFAERKKREDEDAAAKAQKELEERQAREAKLAAEAKSAAEKTAAEAKVREDAFLAATESGQVFMGIWQGAKARGEVGLKFGERLKMQNGYSFEGILFDPANPAYEKPFSAASSGNGTADSPYELEIRVINRGGIVSDAPYLFQNTTAGFLVDISSFSFPLRISEDSSTLSGTLDRSFMFKYLNEGPVVFQLSKDYKPKAKPTKDAAAASVEPSLLEDTSAPVSEEEASAQVVASQAIQRSFLNAVIRRDNKSAKSILEKMKSQFPDALTTFSNEMFIAAMDKDSKKVRAVYEVYLKTFDNIPGQKGTHRRSIQRDDGCC